MKSQPDNDTRNASSSITETQSLILEQLCLLRADVDALHGILAFLGHNDDVKIERVEQIREAIRDQSYRKIRAELSAKTRADAPSRKAVDESI